MKTLYYYLFCCGGIIKDCVPENRLSGFAGGSKKLDDRYTDKYICVNSFYWNAVVAKYAYGLADPIY